MTLKEFLDQACGKISSGWFIAALTDELAIDTVAEIGKWNLLQKEDKVLEVRVFGGESEYKLYRSDIGKDFIMRAVSDSDYDDDHKFTEVQLLDIDEKKGRLADGFVRATGGGKYHLPLRNTADAAVKIRYYLDKTSVHARVVDWRVVEFVEGK